MAATDLRHQHQLARDLDRPFLANLPPSKRLIVVLGLHRSGTTFLYQLLSDHFPLAVTRLVQITHYQRLLYGAREGLTATYEAQLRAHLEARGIADRGIDGFAVGPDTLEEYAFILRTLTPHWGFHPRHAATFDQMARKLSALQPEGQALLLKNPFDLASAPAILEAHPETRFVMIRRDPVRVLNSQFRNSFLYRKQPEPYLDVLLEGIPAWRLNFRLMAALNHLVPDPAYQAVLVNGLRRSIERQLEAHYRSLAALPVESYVEVGYEELIADPAPTLERLADFLDLPFREGASPIAASPRLEPLLPAVAAAEPAFRRQLDRFPDARRVHTLPREATHA